MARNGTTSRARKSATSRTGRNYENDNIGIIAPAESKKGLEYDRLILDVDAVREALDAAQTFKSRSTGKDCVSFAIFGNGNLSFVKKPLKR